MEKTKTKNGIADLSDILFSQLERLSNDDLTMEQIVLESERSNSIIGISKQLIDDYRVQLDACKVAIDNGYQGVDETKLIPKQLISHE